MIELDSSLHNADWLKRHDDVAASLPPGTDVQQWLEENAPHAPLIRFKRITKGEAEGHEFRGNRYTGGIAGEGVASGIHEPSATETKNAMAIMDRVGYHVDASGSSPEMVAALHNIMDNVDPGRRAAGMAWYQSVHDAAIEMAAKHSVPPEVAFAVIAACSRNMAWSNAAGDKYPNAQLADTVLQMAHDNPSFHIDEATSQALAGAVSSSTGNLLGMTTVAPGDYKFSELPVDIQGFIAVRSAGTGGIPDAVETALNIVHGASIDEELTGNKIRSFDNNIADPNNPNYACVDRWAARATFGFPIGGNAKNADDVGRMPLKDSEVESLRSNNAGYKIMAASYIQVGRDYGITPSQAQAVIWMATTGYTPSTITPLETLHGYR